MLRLRKILLLKSPYVILFLVSCLYLALAQIMPKNSLYAGTEETIEGYITEMNFDGAKLSMTIKGKEPFIASYYAKTEEERKKLQQELSLGDTVLLTGTLNHPHTTKNFNSFSYQEYLARNQIFYFFQADSITRVKKNQNILWCIKTKIKNFITSFNQNAKYINTFVLGNQNDVEKEVRSNFQKIGISHLFALSGTQITFLSDLIQKILTKRKKSDLQKLIITQSILLSYYLVIDPCAAIDRALVFQFFFSVNKTYDFHISPFQLILLSLSVLFLWHPNYIFDIGFQYATVISVGLILYSTKKKQHSKIAELFFVSLLSFLFSIPISLYHFSKINPLSILYNLFYVPYINFLVFPLSIITLCLPFCSPLLSFFTTFLEKSVSLLAKIPFGELVFAKAPLILYLFYAFLIAFLLLGKKKKLWFLLLLLTLGCHFIAPKIVQEDRLFMIDVGQGDSFLIQSEGKTLLIDTGGKMEYVKEDWQKGKEKTKSGTYTISFLSSLGITKLDYLLITHGDADHAKEAITLIDQIPIGKIYYNEGKINSLEKEILKEAKQKKIDFEQLKQNQILKLGNFTFQVLSKDLEEENDSSIILYGERGENTLLFMGDASIKSEQELLKTYTLKEIDFLKIGHHGSRTSSSESFLAQIKPKVGLISAGVDNSFNHPHQDVVKRYQQYGTTLFSTITDGMVEINFTTRKIKTYMGKQLSF